MEINHRIKQIRTSLDLTQTNFGTKIGMKQNTVGQIENGQRGVTDRTILLICEKYNVNEEWLRNGEGAMFTENKNDLLLEVAKHYHLDELDKKILKVFLELSPEKRAVFKELAYSLISDIIADVSYKQNNMHDDIETKQENTSSDKTKIFRAARSKANTVPEILETNPDFIAKLKTLPKVTSDDDL